MAQRFDVVRDIEFSPVSTYATACCRLPGQHGQRGTRRTAANSEYLLEPRWLCRMEPHTRA